MIDYDTRRLQPPHIPDRGAEASSRGLPRQDHRQHHPADGGKSEGG